MLEAIKVWPGKGEACRKVGVIANLYRFCAHLCQRCAGRDEETGFEIKPRNRLRPGELLDKENPIQGPCADSEEKHDPVSDIDIAVVDSLKALDPKRPIREADIHSGSRIVC